MLVTGFAQGMEFDRYRGSPAADRFALSNLGKLKGVGANENVTAVVETTKGSRTKLDYDLKHRCFVVSKVLPEGMSFPFDFGFIPSTTGGDGDPLDVILLLDESVPSGTVVPARLIGVIEATQTSKRDRTDENDRLLAVGSSSVLYDKVRKLSDLPAAVVEQIEQFFVSYNRLEGKEFVVKDHHGLKRARECVRRGRRRFSASAK
jgi:inorganic pyrophosphatase